MPTMNRRNFLGKLIGGVAATAAVRTWPFRVYSFPRRVRVDHLDLMRWGEGTFSELWGANLTPADINAAGFGFSIPANARIIAVQLELNDIDNLYADSVEHRPIGL